MNKALCVVLALWGCAIMTGRVIAEKTRFASAIGAAQWKVRDVAADTQLIDPSADARAKKLDLKLERRDDPSGTVWRSSCTVISQSPADRAVTLSFCIPLDARQGVWWDDPQRSRPVAGKEQFANLVYGVGIGSTGRFSKYPLAVLAVGNRALCIAAPIEPPRIVTLLYDPAKREFRAEFDFGLSNIPKHFQSHADASVVVFEVPAKWAFRQALARYYQLYPEAFTRRAKRVGIWLPFAPIDIIERVEDFGIVFHELGVEHPDWIQDDEKNGADSYLYTEPQTNWRGLRGEGKGPYADWVSQLWEDALKGDAKSQATLTSGVELADGRRDLYLGPVAYTKSAPFGVNCDPEVPTDEWGAWPNKADFEMQVLSKGLGWNTDKPTGADGVYVDSMEGWGQIQNYNRAHWRATRYPLTFDYSTRKVCLLNFWGNYAFVKSISEKLHAKGQCLMANDAYFRFWQLAPHVDIPGREYTWFEKEKWTPVPDENYLFFRSMSATKPYVMLMNNAFEDGSHMEEYFQRSLFYAVFPSMFVGHTRIGECAYFYNPEWYNRDRHLFVKYIPLIRKLDAAGWQPVPNADATPASIRIERYGTFASGSLAITVHNPTAKSQKVELILSAADLNLPKRISAMEWITGEAVAVGDGFRLSIGLRANGYAVIGIAGGQE